MGLGCRLKKYFQKRKGEITMKNITVYSSVHCGACPAVKAWLTAHGVEYTTIDISSGMLPLKQFLKYRDTREEFAFIREAGRVGLPCIVINKGEKILFDPAIIAEELGIPNDVANYRQ